MFAQEIAGILATIRYSDWRPRWNQDTYVNMAFIDYWVTVKNGQRWRMQAAASVVLSGRDWLLNTPEQRTRYRKEISEASLQELLERQVAGRTGLKEHRGYFRIVKLEAERRRNDY